MSEAPVRPPSYRLHKASGQAVVTIRGKARYLGEWGGSESKLKYRRLVREHLDLEIEALAETLVGNPNLTIDELIAAYWDYAEQVYVNPETGKPKPELFTFDFPTVSDPDD